MSPIFDIIAIGTPQELEAFLVEHPEDVQSLDSKGESTLHTALMSMGECSLELMQLLIQFGAKPHTRDAHGWLPLHLAAAKNNLAAVELLIQHGAQIDVRTHHGLTALEMSIEHGNDKMSNWLSAYAKALEEKELLSRETSLVHPVSTDNGGEDELTGMQGLFSIRTKRSL